MNHRIKTMQRWSELVGRYQFRIDRAEEIKAYETPVRLAAGARQILHLLPLSAVDSREESLDFSEIYDGNEWPLILGLGSASRRYNIDGLCVFSPGGGEEQEAYAQLHRNGLVEAVLAHESAPGRLPGSTIDEFVVNAARGCRQIYETLGIQAPVVVMLTLIGVNGWRIAGVDKTLSEPRHDQIDRDLVLAPETVIEAFDEDLPIRLRPAIDAMWNAAGWPASPNFDERGNWMMQR